VLGTRCPSHANSLGTTIFSVSQCVSSDWCDEKDSRDKGGVHFQRIWKQFQPVWRVLHNLIEHCSNELRVHSDAAQTFYNFLYTFVLRREERDECIRRQLAVEIWEMFFIPFIPSPLMKEEKDTDHYLVHSEKVVQPEEPKQTPCSTLHLAVFPHLPSWIAFVQSPSFYAFPVVNDEEDEEEGEGKEENESSPLYGGNTISYDMWQQLWFFAKLPNYENYDFMGAWPNAMDGFVQYMHRCGGCLSLPL